MQKRVLDYGYVKLLNVAGPVRRADAAYDAHIRDIAKAARVSFGAHAQDKGEEQDKRLARYLWANKHLSPFEMLETWWEMKLPIFVARQFVRHRTASINEISGRYVKLPDDWYIPNSVGSKPVNNKQGRGDVVTPALAREFRETLDKQCSESYAAYEQALAAGVCPEQARSLLHLNHYTVWLFKMDLRNLLHFLALRTDSHAQQEAREYAEAMQALLMQALPDVEEFF